MAWKRVIGELAPTLALALQSPLRGMAMGNLCEALALPGGSSDEEVEKQLASHPELLTKVKDTEIQFKKKIRALGIDLEKILTEEGTNHSHLMDKVPGFLAFAITIGFFWTLYHVLVNGIAEKVDAMLVGSLLGTIGTAWIQLVSYYFGSSRSSDKKSEIIATLRK